MFAIVTNHNEVYRGVHLHVSYRCGVEWWSENLPTFDSRHPIKTYETRKEAEDAAEGFAEWVEVRVVTLEEAEKLAKIA